MELCPPQEMVAGCTLAAEESSPLLSEAFAFPLVSAAFAACSLAAFACRETQQFSLTPLVLRLNRDNINRSICVRQHAHNLPNFW